MGLVPVNAQQATSVVGHRPVIDDEFLVTHLTSTRPNHLGKTSDALTTSKHRGNQQRDGRNDDKADRGLNDTGNLRQHQNIGKTSDLHNSNDHRGE
jgi:hypothetical protein